MLTDDQSAELFEQVSEAQKEVMKSVLNQVRMGFDDSRFNHFKKQVFNLFGTSGLETTTKEIIQEYTEES